MKFRNIIKLAIKVVVVFSGGMLLLSISPKKSVWTTMAFSGHPIKAIMSDPKRDKSLDYGSERYYTISDKYSYKSLDITVPITYVFMIHNFLIFYLAFPTEYPD